MKKKILSLVLLIVLFGNPFSFTFAKSKVIYERSENLAKQYIENSLNDDNWINKNPYISGEGRKFYTDDEKNPSYIEFKVSCDNQKDCGFILVNSDGNDVAVPIASTSGVGPGELLSLQNESKVSKKNKDNKINKKSNNKLYYFGPLEQYSIDEENEEFISINPQDEIEQILENDKTLKKEDKDKEIKNKKRELKTRVDDYKIKAKEYKKSDDFKKHKEEIKDEILKMPKEEFVFEKLDMAFADLGNEGNLTNSYTLPGTSDKIITGNTTTGCNSKIPCYNQYTTSYTPPLPYTSAVCYSGCSPTAVAMLFGYYDRNGFSDLITGTASDTLNIYNPDSNIVSLINNVRTYIGTSCIRKGTTNVYYGSSSSSNVYKAKQYAINNKYPNTTSEYITGTISSLFSKIKTEINYGRPMILHLISNDSPEGHAVVGYGYKSTGTTPIVRINMGWGNRIVPGTTSYYYSNYDVNLNLIFYNGSNSHSVNGITTFIIKS